MRLHANRPTHTQGVNKTGMCVYLWCVKGPQVPANTCGLLTLSCKHLAILHVDCVRACARVGVWLPVSLLFFVSPCACIACLDVIVYVFARSVWLPGWLCAVTPYAIISFIQLISCSWLCHLCLCACVCVGVCVRVLTATQFCVSSVF